MRKSFLLFLLSLLVFVTKGENLPGTNSKPNVAGIPEVKNLTVKGKVVEADTSTPMGYANVAIFSAADSTVAGGIMTSDNGTFEIKNLKPGNYFLSVNFVGYSKKTVPVKLIAGKPFVDIGIVQLNTSEQKIKEVEVVADRQRVEFKLDRRVVNVSQNIVSTGGTAVEVLENTPSVATDFEGNVTLRGSSNFTVLIDGKPSVVKGSDALRQLPAAGIERIEIITNPSAKYDPDGDTGIINVVMKRNQKDSFSGLINLTAGLNHKYRGDANFTFRTKKFDFMLGADFADMQNKGSRDMLQRITSGDTLTTRRTLADGTMLHKGHNLKGGFDYFLSPFTTIGMVATVGTMEHGDANAGYKTTTYNLGLPTLYEYLDNSSSRSSNYWSGNVNFTHKFDKKGHELQGMFYFSGETGDDISNNINIVSDANWKPIESDPYKYRSNESPKEHEYRAKLDYTKPFDEKTRLEAGYQGRFQSNKEDFVFEEFDYASNSWKKNNLYSSLVNYDQNIHALYGTFSHANEGFSFQAGLRTEYTQRKLISERANKTYSLNRFDFFPTLHLSQKLKKEYEIQASYSRRLNRPEGFMLEPFPTLMDPYNIRIGNPELTPEYAGSYELTLLKHYNTSFVSLEGYYRHTKDLMTRIQTLGEDGIMYHTMANINNDYSLGSELMINYEIKPGYRLVASGTLYNYWLKGNVSGVSVDQQSTNFDGKLNLDMRLAKDTRFQLMGVYRGPTVSAQGRRDGMYFLNASVRQDLMKNKLTATLQVQDIFGTMKFSGSSAGANFENQFKYKRESQIIQLTLSYKLNNFKAKPGKEAPESSGNEGGGMGEF
ncbi:MAG: TonB-dependent receptor [Marinilabiliales bacterium]|nr:TonB-dependent receptor [Marinilabiliales bacterium]